MYLGIFLTLIMGLSFLIGIVTLRKLKNKDKISIFTTSLAFIVMLGLVMSDILPEIIETKNIYLIIPTTVGFIFFIILDKFIPHHHHDHAPNCNKEEHNLHLNHIGIITIVAFIIHNIIEGMSLYNVTFNSIKNGILMSIGISLHNIPLGFQIGNSLNEKSTNKILIFFLCISSFLGSIIMILFGSMNEYLEYVLLSITLGMLLYLIIFELFNELRKNLEHKETLYGIIIGIIVILITHIF